MGYCFSLCFQVNCQLNYFNMLTPLHVTHVIQAHSFKYPLKYINMLPNPFLIPLSTASPGPHWEAYVTGPF